MNEKATVTLRNGESFQVIAALHNLRFVSAKAPVFRFRVKRFPYKKIANFITEKESGEVQDVQVFLCVQSTMCNTSTFFEVRYGVKTWQTSKTYIVEEKAEQVFSVDIEKNQVIRMVETYLSEALHFNQKSTAENMIRYFTEWAYPPKLEELIQDLTEEQQRKVARYIKKIAA